MNYFGLFKPWGYKNNCFMVFRTTNPLAHYLAIVRKHQEMENDGFFEMTKMIAGYSSRSYVYYTKNQYPKSMFNNLLQSFARDRNVLYESNQTKKIRYWPFVRFSENGMINSSADLDKIMKNIKPFE